MSNIYEKRHKRKLNVKKVIIIIIFLFLLFIFIKKVNDIVLDYSPTINDSTSEEEKLDDDILVNNDLENNNLDDNDQEEIEDFENSDSDSLNEDSSSNNNTSDNNSNDNNTSDNNSNDNDTSDNDSNDNNSNDNDSSDNGSNDNNSSDNNSSDNDSNDNDTSDNDSSDNGSNDNDTSDNDTNDNDSNDNNSNDDNSNDDYLSNDDYVYEGEEENIYLIDIQSQIKNVYDKSSVVKYELDHQGDKISLYDGENEVKFDKGISVAGGDVCITFANLKMYGYETFTAYFGTHYIARENNLETTSFSFKIVLDYEVVYESDIFTAYSEYEYVEIDLEGYEVIQIFIDTNGSSTGDYAAIGDPMFIKDSPSPYIDVFDLEFNSPHQVTESNLLQYADAWDLDLTNISDDVYYETNYVAGEIGDFLITYYVYGQNGVRASREVNLIVTGQDYTQAWTAEDYRTPYVNYLYHPRNTLTPQNRQLFDIVMEGILNFNPEGGEYYTVNDYTYWGETVYEVRFDLEAAGIFLTPSEYNGSFYQTILDADPRAYLFKQWNLSGRYTSNSETGMLKTYHVCLSKSWANSYDTQIEKIIENAENFLEYSKDDMTDAQKLYYVTTPYKNWISYTDGATLSTAMGNGYGKCEGNAMGVVHLAQRLGISSFYAHVYAYSGTELHAASYQKLVDEDGWYMTDKLWGYQWTAPEATSFVLVKRSGYGWIDYATSSMSSYKYTTYPSIWLDFEEEVLTIEKGGSIDLISNVNSISSVFDEVLTTDIIDVYIKNDNGEIVSNDTSNLDSGIYTIYYNINYESSINVNRVYELELIVYETQLSFSASTVGLVIGSSNVNGYGSKGLYNSTTKQEEYYYGVDINNGGYITLDNSEEYNAISLKYGTKEYCRTDSWAITYAKVALYVYFDGVLQTNTGTLTAFSNYATIKLYIPDGVSEIKLYSKDVGGQSGHATIGDIQFYSIN